MRLILILLVMVTCEVAQGQYKGSRFPIKDDWFWNYGAKGLQVGDKMPDLALTSIMNNKTGKTKLSQFRGKLVILDFWNTRCTSCIEGLPKMEALQKEFGDKIQIILVDQWETKEQIKERMAESYGKPLRLPDLPCIVSNREYDNWKNFDGDTPLIARYFPMQAAPHHVWIDGNGIIKLRGVPENTYAAKIKELLSGKPIQVLQDNNTVPDLFKDNASYYSQLGFMRKTAVSYGSFITPYNSEIAAASPLIRERIDSNSGTRVTTYINQSLLMLYRTCLGKNKALKLNEKLLFCPGLLDFVLLPKGNDTLLYTSESWIVQHPLTTEENIRSKYCYEQVVPLATSEDERMQMMLEDLNRYLKNRSGITGAVETRKVRFYELIRISDQDKVTASSTGFEYSTKVVNQEGKSILNYNASLRDVFAIWLQNKQLTVEPGLLYDASGIPFFIYNGTGWNSRQLVSMKIPLTDLKSIDDIRRLLQPFGLGLVEKTGELPFFVFTRVDQPANNHKQ